MDTIYILKIDLQIKYNSNQNADCCFFFLVEIDELILKCMCKIKRSLNKNMVGSLTCKTDYKDTIIMRTWY